MMHLRSEPESVRRHARHWLSQAANVASHAVPRFASWRLARQRRLAAAPIRWGTFRRVTPISRYFGFERGQCIDRHYIEAFLAQHSLDIRGRVLEVAEATYTRRFGGDRVTASDVLHACDGNSAATYVGDLASGRGIPTAAFDCAIVTQTLPHVFDIKAAIEHLHAALVPGGVLLATFPGISQISRYDMDRWGDYWRLTDASARRLFADAFGDVNVTVTVHGNVLAACAFLHGLAAHELAPEELDYVDPDYQLLIAVRACKVLVPNLPRPS